MTPILKCYHFILYSINSVYNPHFSNRIRHLGFILLSELDAVYSGILFSAKEACAVALEFNQNQVYLEAA